MIVSDRVQLLKCCSDSSEEMEILAGSSTHGEVSAREVSSHSVIPYTLWVPLGRTLQCYQYKVQHHHELLPGDFEKRRAFTV